jgi:hypothetical protein
MTTRHMQLAVAIADRLKLDPAIAGSRVYVNRVRAIGSDKVAVVVVRLGRGASEEAEVLGGRTTWSTLIEIECYGRDGADDVPGTAADQLLEKVFDNLDEADLGYGVMSVAPLAGDTLAWDFEQLDTGIACVVARFVVKHQTNGRTLKL